MLVSGQIAKRWLERHGGVRVQSRIENAGHLERDWGSNIREHFTADADPAVLATWMLTECGVSVPSRVCQSWLTRDWATAGGLRVCDQVEEQLGEGLVYETRLPGRAIALHDKLSSPARTREPHTLKHCQEKQDKARERRLKFAEEKSSKLSSLHLKQQRKLDELNELDKLDSEAM